MTLISLSLFSACTALEWDPLGLSLAIAQANSSVVLLWFTRQWKTRAVDVGVKVEAGSLGTIDVRDAGWLRHLWQSVAGRRVHVCGHVWLKC